MISKKRINIIFLEALLLTLIIYSGAFFFNNYLDSQRLNQLNNNFENSKLNFYSYQISNIFFENFNKDSNEKICKIQKKFIFNNFLVLKELGLDINNYGQLFSEGNKNYSLNKQRKYFLDQLSIYRIVLNYNKLCKNQTIIPVIYFFNGKDNNLDKQSLILKQFSLNNINKSIIFSFDINYEDEPLLTNIKKKYNITFTPFVILNNKTTRNMKNENLIIDLNTIAVEYKKARGEI